MITMKSFKGSCLLATMALAAFATAAHAMDSYRLTVVGPSPTDPDYRIIYANAMNDKAEIVGGLYGTSTGILWRDGELTELPSLNEDPGSWREAFGLNDRSVLVGLSQSPEGTQYRPAIWRDGEIEDSGAFPEEARVTLHDINHWGVMVGNRYVDPIGPGDPFIQRGDHIVELPALPNGSGYAAAGYINEWNVVAGTSDSGNGLRAVIWWLGNIHELPSPQNSSRTEATGINDWSDVAVNVGYPDAGSRAAWWHHGQLTELPLLYPTGDNLNTAANGINNRRQIVGGWSAGVNGVSVQKAVLWENGAVYALDDLIGGSDPLKPYVSLISAQFINNRGEILAVGYDSRAPFQSALYLARPVR
jgi:probable HAF family extracellular repeat protein